MKALGIVRKIDGLGRVVIPKEIRNTNGWGPGTALEMFATEEGLVLREYGREKEAQEILKKLNDADELTSNASIKSAIKQAKEFVAKG